MSDAEPLFIVRLYDGMDNQWCDVTEPLPGPEAMAVWNDKTDKGYKNAKFDDIDYYKVFPADTKMQNSGGFGETYRPNEPGSTCPTCGGGPRPKKEGPKDVVLRCQAFRCGFEAVRVAFKPSPNYAHDLKCPKCGSYEIDTSELAAKLGETYEFGDNNYRGGGHPTGERVMPEEDTKAYDRGDQGPPHIDGKCFACNWFAAWPEGVSGVASDGRILGGETSEPGGTCRKKAPLWEIISANDWCGEWEKRE